MGDNYSPANGARAGDQAAAPLVQALREYAARNPVRLHVPGHKGRGIVAGAGAGQGAGHGKGKRKGSGAGSGGAGGGSAGRGGAADPGFACLLGDGAFAVDVTEVDCLDNLHAPQGPIREAQRLVAQAYGADASLFLVNGSTCGLLAAIMASCGPGDEIIVPRDTHRAVLGGLVLSGARPVYVVPEVDELFQIPLGPSPEALDEALRHHPRARAVVLTNPNYYGVAPDIKTLVAMVHDYGKIAVVDEAHGSHLPFHEALPPSALEAGADVVVSGAHKTLPAMTQASFLHLTGGAVDTEAVRRMLRLVETTSPSYVLMASLDAARRVAATRGRELLDHVIRAAASARERLARLPGVACLGAERLAATGFTHDPTKLVVSLAGVGITGPEAARWLRERHGVQVELADARNVLAMLTMADSGADVEALVEAIGAIVTSVAGGNDEAGVRRAEAAAGDVVIAQGLAFSDALRHVPPQRMTPRKAAFSPAEWVSVDAALGRVAADAIVPYPPGVPVVWPGEEITGALVDFLRGALCPAAGVEIHGMRRGDGHILVVAER